tara:strand:+ start:9745 stop:10680 length:936 start_codon:yes stop_codon:yes gene_type:complete
MIRSAIIGCGNIAGGLELRESYNYNFTHAGVIESSDNFSLVTASDIDQARLSNFCSNWSLEHGYADYKEMISEENIDLVVVALPIVNHYECLDYLLDSDVKIIFCEKPLTETIGQADNLKGKINDKIFCINFFRKWNKAFSTLARNIQQNKYGNFLSGNAWYTKDLLTNGSHLIHLANWLIGQPLTAELGYKNRNKYSPNFRLVYDTQNLEFQHITSSNYVLLEMDLVFEEGRVRITQRGQKLAISSICSDQDYGFNKLEEENFDTPWRDCLTEAYKNINKSLENEQANLCSFQEGYEVMTVIEKINKSIS